MRNLVSLSRDLLLAISCNLLGFKMSHMPASTITKLLALSVMQVNACFQDLMSIVRLDKVHCVGLCMTLLLDCDSVQTN